MWNGEEYLQKMISDTNIFANNKQLCLWLGFSLVNNPFFVPQDVFVPVSDLFNCIMYCNHCLRNIELFFGKAIVCCFWNTTAQTSCDD